VAARALACQAAGVVAAHPQFVDFAALADEVARLRLLDRRVDVPAYYFAIELRGTATPIGRILLRLDTDESIRLYAGNIGYEVDPGHRGRGHAARACRLLRPLAVFHGVAELWIVTSPDNLASRRTAELAGGQYVDTRPMPPDTDMFAMGMLEARRYRWVL
jgi:predicted acetyltransferase